MARVLYKLVAFVAGAVLGSAATVSCGGAYGPDCAYYGAAAEKCWGETRGMIEQSACEACAAAGRLNSEYERCWGDNTCEDTNDTDMLPKIANCLSGKTWCE